MTITVEDIITIDIPEKVLQAAKDLNLFAGKEKSLKYRPLRPDHDEIGLIGHWAVEVVLHRWRIPFVTTRKIRYQGGDEWDLEILEKYTDVKSSTIGNYNERYYYNQDFYILKDWTDDPKSDLIDDYIFVHLNRDITIARLFGVLPRQELLQCPVVGPQDRPIKLLFQNYQVKSRQLISFYKYIYRT